MPGIMQPVDPQSYVGGNAVLDALPAAELNLLRPHIVVRQEDEATVTRLREGRLDGVHFPIDAIFSVVVEMTRGDAYEVGVIGREGVVGAEIVLGTEVAPRTVLCQAGGRAAFLERAVFSSIAGSSTALRDGVCASLQRQWFISQQTVACNFAHGLDQRIARWLLMTHDGVGCSTFSMRLEFIKLMVAADVEALRAAMDGFVYRKRIRYDDERVVVLSRSGLREDACECYQAQLMAASIINTTSI
jgi:hypothetical protein